MKSIFAVSVLIAVCALTDGCATASSRKAIVNSPPNSIVVDNRTPYMLYVSRNGKPWMVETEDHTLVQERISPKRISILSDCAANAQEKITFDFTAIEQGRAGCLIFTEKIGMAQRTVVVGTDSPAQAIIVRTWNIH